MVITDEAWPDDEVCKVRLTTPGSWSKLRVKLALHIRMATTARVENRVKEKRLARGLTQDELARIVGVSRQSINSIERGRYIPSLQLALKFAVVFDCPVDELFKLVEGMKRWQPG